MRGCQPLYTLKDQGVKSTLEYADQVIASFKTADSSTLKGPSSSFESISQAFSCSINVLRDLFKAFVYSVTFLRKAGYKFVASAYVYVCEILSLISLYELRTSK